jgi:hypothetical protein
MADGGGWSKDQLVDYNFIRRPTYINYFGFVNVKDFMVGNTAVEQKFRRTIGYDFWTPQLTVNVSATRVRVSIDYRNEAGDGLHNQYPLKIIFRLSTENPSANVRVASDISIELDSDIRKRTPRGGVNATTPTNMTTAYDVARPAGLVKGKTYKMFLHYPDRAPQIADDGRYAIPLSNNRKGTQTRMPFGADTGYNDMELNITLTR